ncbi:MAG: diadenylate cyclase [Acidimicrobiales bacterium]
MAVGANAFDADGSGARAQSGRLRRLTEELADEGFSIDLDDTAGAVLLEELDYALRPAVHERRVPSFGAILAPTRESADWEAATELTVTHRNLDGVPLVDARRFADGLSSWLVRRDDGLELAVFDRPAGSERDLVVMAEAMGATIVQRHPSGLVRIVGSFGVLRWDGLQWHREPPVAAWIDEMSACSVHGDRAVVGRLLEFAVHDLGARNIGALLIYQPSDEVSPTFELRLAEPPTLRITSAADLAPLRHVLAQIDGAAVFDVGGVLRQLGVRLVPSAAAEADVDGLRGMRHTSARRYSFDDSNATVIVVSEDGPVTVMRNGEVLGRSEGT